MPFDSEGVFLRVHCWEDDRVNNIDIVTDHMDEEDDNFADGLSQCFLKNGTSKMDGNVNVGNFRVMNMADGALPKDAVNRGQLDEATKMAKVFLNALFKVGDIKASMQMDNHDNWVLCNGQELLRSEYADLYSLIGTKFGEGNGVTTFNVPDYRGKFLRGLGGNSAPDFYSLQNEGLPNISGKYTADQMTGGGAVSAEGAFYSVGRGDYSGTSDSNSKSYVIGFDASKSSVIYGASEHVTPENYAVNWFIKAKEEK